MPFVESQWNGNRKVDGESFGFDVTLKAGQDGQFTGFLTGHEQFKISQGIINSLNNVSFTADLIYQDSVFQGTWDEANKSIKGTTSDGEFELHLQSPATATPFPSKAPPTTGPTVPAQTDPHKDSPSETGASAGNPAPITQPADSSSASSIPAPRPGPVVWIPYQGTWYGPCFKGCTQECKGDFKSDESGNFTFNYSLEGNENDRETVHGVMQFCGEEIKGTGTIDGSGIGVTFVMARSNGDMSFVRETVTKQWTHKGPGVSAPVATVKPAPLTTGAQVTPATPNAPPIDGANHTESSRIPEHSSPVSVPPTYGQNSSYLDLIKALFGTDTKPRTFQDWEEAATLRTEDLKVNGSPSPLIWVLVKGKNIPANAIVGGMEKHQPLYIARAFYEGELCIGKAGRQLEKGAAIPYNGHEVPVDTYEVLVPAMEPVIRYKYSETLCMPVIPRTTLKPETKPACTQVAETITRGVYFIQNYGTGTVIDLVKASPADGTKIQGYSKRELSDNWVSAQLWVINQVGSDNTYTIQNVAGDTFMTLNKSGCQIPVECTKANNTDNQKWEISRSRHTCTAYVIRNKATGTYIDLLNGSRSDGTEVNGWDGSGVDSDNPHQLWHVIGA